MKRLGLLVALVALSGCEAHGEQPGFVVLPGMHYSVPYDAYSTNPVIGPTLREPPEGTVPLGANAFTYGPSKKEADLAGRELTNPLVGTNSAKAELQRGKGVYDIFCLVCHGAAGEGDGPIIGRFPNPPNLLTDKSRKMPDGKLYHIIYHGQGLMPPYAAQVQDIDRWRVILYLRWLQEVMNPQTAEDSAGTQDTPGNTNTQPGEEP